MIQYAMKNTISLLTLLVAGILHSQTVQVNPDGTHTVVHQTDSNTSVQVNPDGTHTVTTAHVKVNPDGTHTVVHEGKAASVEVNPDGTHTVVHHNETNPVQVNPDGTHTILPKKDGRQSKKKKTEKTATNRQ